MELPFEKTVCRCWKQKLYTLVNREETQELKIPESMPDVGRIISSWGQVILRGKDWRSGGIGLNGGVMVWVLYAPENGGELQRLESWIPFQARADFPEPQEDGIIRVETFLRGVDARAVSSRKLMLRAGVGLLVQALTPDELELLRMGDLPKDVEKRVERYPFVLTREAGERTFLVDEDLNLPAGMAPVAQLVYYRMNPEILEQKVLGSKAAFRGAGNLHILYIDPDGRLSNADFQVPFAQFVELDGEYESDATVTCLLCLTSLELDVQPDGSLRLKCGMVSQHLINAQENVEILEDCYSPVRELILEKQLLSIPAWLEEQKRPVDLTASISGETGQPIDLIFFPDPPNVKNRSGGADVELGGAFQSLMLNGQGQYSSGTERQTQSFHLDTACDTVCFVGTCSAPSIRSEAGCWRTDTRLVLDLGSICTKPMETVSGIRLGELKEPDPERASVIIRTKGRDETLWDVAKRCGSTVGAIRRMNHLEGEPDESQLLLIPVI